MFESNAHVAELEEAAHLTCAECQCNSDLGHHWPEPKPDGLTLVRRSVGSWLDHKLVRPGRQHHFWNVSRTSEPELCAKQTAPSSECGA